MINLVLPFAAIAFAFVVSVLVDIRQRKFNPANMINHSTRLGIYLAAVAMMEVLSRYEPALTKYILYIAMMFTFSELANTALLIKSVFGANDPMAQAISQAVPQAEKLLEGGVPTNGTSPGGGANTK